MPKLLKFGEFTEELPEITTTKVVDKKKFHSEGLFSEQIFGPLKNFTCQCGIYYGTSGAGGTCNECGVDVVNSDERRRRFAKIVLPIPVVNPVFYDLVIDLAGNSVRDAIKKLMRDHDSCLTMDDGDLTVISTENLEPGAEAWIGVEAIRELVFKLASTAVEEDPKSEWNIVYDNIDELIIKHIIVLPADLRPATKGSIRSEQYADKINRFYMQILTKKEVIEQSLIDIRRDNVLLYNHFRQLQKDVNELYTYILEKLSKKEGLIRGNILGKRIDFSGRAVIVPDPTLKLDHCSIPYIIFLEIFKIEVAKRLMHEGRFKLLNQAIDFIDECVELNLPVLFSICKELVVGEVCILNRQPSLHKLSMLAFYIDVSLDSVIKIHPLACPPFNADFDGDQMAIYVPISKETKQEVIDKILITKNLKNPSNGSLTTTPSQDMVLGIYALTNHKFPSLQSEVEHKNTKVTEDVRIFNECFPPDYPLIDEPVNSKRLVQILNDINNKYEPDIVSEVLDKIKYVGFIYSTLFGPTLSLDDCNIEGIDTVRDEIYSSGTLRNKIFKISTDNDELMGMLREGFKYSYMIESGARGSWDQAKQIVLSRGFVSNFNGQIIAEPIVNSFISGLSPKGFFNSTYGSRKGLLDVALNTGASGYLSRKLIFTTANLLLSYELEDCGTTDTLEVFVRDNKKAKQIINKWAVIDDDLVLITEENYKTFINKTIKVRSPIYCCSEKICHVCYGKLFEDLKTKFVGIIAAQSLGECNTQLVLRTFHTSGVANIGDEDSEDDLKQQDIISDLSMVSKLLHKFGNTKPEELVDKLYTTYNTSRTINHVHFECVVSQLMWAGIQKWRLLANRSNITPVFHSVQTVPSLESWLMGLAFSNPKKHIIKGILQPGLYKGIMDKILCGERI